MDQLEKDIREVVEHCPDGAGPECRCKMVTCHEAAHLLALLDNSRRYIAGEGLRGEGR